MRIEGDMRLGINQEMVNSACDAVADFWDEPDLVATVVRKRMADILPLQPHFIGFLRDFGWEIGVKDPLTFVSAAVLAYDMVPLGQRNNPFTQDEIEVVSRSLREHIVEEEGKQTKIDLSWLSRKLKEDSPEFVEWIEYTESGLDEEIKSDFLLGALLAVAPFFTRVEAQNFETKFS